MSYTPAPTRYESMRYNRCGTSGLLLPAISLGLWHNFGGVDAPEQGRALLRAAFERGITHFDLANNYGPPPGAAEETLSLVLRQDLGPHRDELVISTKAGYRMWPGPYGEWGSRKYLLASLDQSLGRMGLDYVDIFYHHRPDPQTPLQETAAALAHAVRVGKALYAGISNYPPDLTREMARLLRDMGAPCLIHQPSYNMLNRQVEQGLLAALGDEGIGCIAFCPLAQGLLTSRYLEGIPADSRASKAHGFLKREAVTPEKMEIIRGLHAVAAERSQTLAQMALAWVLRHEAVTSALIGASRVEQIEENVRALDNHSFSASELEGIDRILGAH